MKKITSLLVALTLVFALFSCGGGSQLDEFIDIFENSEPTMITTYVTEDNKDFTLNSSQTTIIYGEDFEIKYEGEKLQIPGPGMNEDEYKKPVSVNIFYHNGQFSVDGGETWTTAMPDTDTELVKFDLGAADIDEYEVDRTGKKLTAVLSAEQAAALLGVAVNANEDGVSLTIEHDGANLRKINVTYTTESETTVTIVTSYTYDAVTSPFAPEEPEAQE